MSSIQFNKFFEMIHFLLATVTATFLLEPTTHTPPLPTTVLFGKMSQWMVAYHWYTNVKPLTYLFPIVQPAIWMIYPAQQVLI